MKNTVTMAELMKKVQAYGQPQNLDEGFASDASRRAAFAQGYKAKGKKDKKEETLDEKLSTSQIGTLKKTFEPLRGKKIGPNAQKKLMQIMDKLDRDKDTLGQLVKADIPFVSQLAVTRLISKHNMTGAQINKLKEETLDEKMKYTHAVVDNNGNVIGFTSNEKDAMFMSKNNLTKKKGAVVKLTKPMSQKQGDMKIGRKLFEEEYVLINEKVSKELALAALSINKNQKFVRASGDFTPEIYLSRSDREKLKKRFGRLPRGFPSQEDGMTVVSLINYALGNKDGRDPYDTEGGETSSPKLYDYRSMKVVGKPKTVGDAAKMAGLRLESVDEKALYNQVDEMAYKPGSFKSTRPQEKAAKKFDDFITQAKRYNDLDLKDYQKARSLYVQASDPSSREKLKKFIFNLDTEPKEVIMNMIGLNDPETFLQMYPNAKKGEPLTRVSFAHRNMKSEEVELEEKVDMQTKSYITDIVSAINRDPKLKYMRPFAKKFKDLAMKTGDVKKSLEAAMPDYVAGSDIMKVLNMGDDNLVNAAANVLGEREIVNEDGHTDVASAIRQCKTMIEDAMQISSKLQGMNPEESLPSWWTNKLAISSNNMNKLRDYFLVPTMEENELDEAFKPDQVKAAKSIARDSRFRDKMVIDKKTAIEKIARGLTRDPEVKKVLDKMYEEFEINEKAGDVSDLKNLVGELVKASGMHLAQSKRVQAHVDMMTDAGDKGPSGVGGINDLKKIVGELEKASEAHKRQSKSIEAHIKFMGEDLKEYIEDELDEVSRAAANKVNSELSKVLGKIRFTHFFNQKGGIFKMPSNVKHEVIVDRNDMKDAADLLMKDKGDLGFMFKQGQLRLEPAMAREVKEWFSKHNCDVKVREIHEGSKVFQAYVPISKTIPNNIRLLTLENQYGTIPEDVEDLNNINYKNIKETSVTMNTDFWKNLIEKKHEDDDSGDMNIMMQLRKSVSLRGMKDVKFSDGKSEKVKANLAQKALDIYNRMKPQDKMKFQSQIAKSYKDLLTAIKGK